MTRAERFAHQEARAKARLETQRKQLAHVQAQRRQAEQKDCAQRWLRVGQLVDQAGLFALDDATLAAVFRSLAPLADSPDPCAVVDGWLHDALRVSVASVDGMAQAAPGVGPCGAKVDLAR
jgi:hypothetical protein